MTFKQLRAIKDWVHGFWGYNYCSNFWINFMTSEEAISKRLLLLCVAPLIMFMLKSFPVTPTKSLAVGGPSSVQ